MFKRCSVELVVAVGVLAAVTIPATALARSDTRTGPSPLAQASKGGDLKVGIAIKRFRANNNQPVAKGTATAQILDYAGHKTIIRQSVTGVPVTDSSTLLRLMFRPSVSVRIRQEPDRFAVRDCA